MDVASTRSANVEAPGSRHVNARVVVERALERDGLISRRIHATVPPRVEYTLTPLGHSLDEVVAQIRHWAYAHMDEIEAARTQYDGKAPTT